VFTSLRADETDEQHQYSPQPAQQQNGFHCATHLLALTNLQKKKIIKMFQKNGTIT